MYLASFYSILFCCYMLCECMSHFHCYMIFHFGIYQNLAIPLSCINFAVVNNPLISLAYNNKHLFLALHIVNYISFGSFLCVFSFQDTE